LGDEVERNGISRACSTHGVEERCIQKSEGKRPLGKPRLKWEDNIKVNLQEVVWGMDWIDVTHVRGMWRALMNALINL
jgi:hypothetical protein